MNGARNPRRLAPRALLAALATALATAGLATDAAEAAPPDRRLAVAVREVAPFAMRTEEGHWEGISVDLWREIAKSQGYRYEFREMGLTEMLDAVAARKADVAVGALTVTAEREARMDFSHPFFSSGLGIAVVPKSGGALGALLERVVSPTFLKAVGALAGILLLAGVLVWIFERRRNPEQFGGGPVKGLGAAFWWAAVTMTTVGYGDKAPQTAGGRLVALVWMFASIILISGFTAGIATALTVGELRSRIAGPEDLPGRLVGTVRASTADAYLRQRGIRRVAAAEAAQALEDLAAGRVEAVVYDAPVLRHLARQDAFAGIEVLPREFVESGYALALPEGSALREPINQALLKTTGSPAWRETLVRYLGAE